MKRFRGKLMYQGTPWVEVEARDVGDALDKMAQTYGWDSFQEMQKAHPEWDEDSGFHVELVRDPQT